ncbi:MAG: hypothetical protein WCP21_08780 [Armatimonadota bacterium]
MPKWLWLCLILAPVLCLAGCGGGSLADPPSPTRGSGVIEADDFNPFDSDGGPLDLERFTLPSQGTYVVSLTSGPDQPTLPQPWLVILKGRVPQSTSEFLTAYYSTPAPPQAHATKVAKVNITGYGGDQFTFVFESWTHGLGAYSWTVAKL